MTRRIDIQVAEKLLPLITTPKRIKIAVGGRGASKSIAFADIFLRFGEAGEKLLCAREYQNSIDESVHSLLTSRIDTLGVADLFDSGAKEITSINKGHIFYKGLYRNPATIKSIHGVNRVWIEEGDSLTDETLDLLIPSIRESDSEIWISMNRPSSSDPVPKRFLKQAESALEAKGIYEDDDILIVEINYLDNPWFPAVLDADRKRDYERLPRAKYNHIWLGHYSDTVDNAIIMPEWFDACIDAHIKLGFKPTGAEIVSHDPADGGGDAAGKAYLHGVVLLSCDEDEEMDVNSACDWAMEDAIQGKVDGFTWDGDGLGASLRRQVSDSLGPKRIDVAMFKGSQGVYDPDVIYEPMDGEINKPKANKDVFTNARAQGWWSLRDAMYRTWEAVEKGVYHNPDDLFSISSKIDKIKQLRSEICRIPKVPNRAGKIQIMSKEKMKSIGIESPNLGDSVMMGRFMLSQIKKRKAFHQQTSSRVEIPSAYSAFA